MPVEVQRAISPDQLPSSAWIAQVVSETWRLQAEEACPAEPGAAVSATGAATEPDICVRLVDEPEGQELNSRFRGKDKPTNVLSFPAGEQLAVQHEMPLGDIVICAPVVTREAAEQHKSLQDHLAHMLVHGVLHLLGYDHERSDAAMREMETTEQGILARFGVSNPYRES